MTAPSYRGSSGRGGGSGPNNRGGSFGGGARGGAGGGRGGGPPQGSRWGNGPPSHSSSPSSANRNAAGPKASGSTNNNNTRGSTSSQQQQQGANNAAQLNSSAAAFPSLGAKLDDSQKLMHDRMLFLLVTLVGNPVTVTVKGGTQYFGIMSAANTSGGDLGVALASAQEILPAKADGEKAQLGALKKMLIINGKDLESVEASEIRIGEQEKEMKEAREKEAFRTDTEISKAFDPLGSGRTLQKWSDDPDLADFDDNSTPAWAASANGGLEEDSSSSKPWDQFAANEARFGIKSNYEETMYTTALDRSGKDFKEREKMADRLAREIMGQATSNPHMAEERGLADDSGINEEDKYGAVVRGPNAYIPPALRKAAAAAAANNQTTAGKSAAPPSAPSSAAPAPTGSAVKSNGAGAAQSFANVAAATQATTIPSAPVATETKAEESAKPPTVNVKVPSPSLPSEEQGKGTGDASNMVPVDAKFRQFVSSERERLEKKKAALAKKEKDTRLADLKTWASTFKLKTPVPSDVADVLKDKAGASDKPRDPTLQKSVSPAPAHAAVMGIKDALASPDPSKASRGAFGTTSVTPSPAGSAATAPTGKGGPRLAETKAMLASMTIPKIPPYNPERAKARQAAAAAAASGGANADPKAVAANGGETSADKTEGVPSSTSTSSFKLSANASTFKPFNPNATAFTPGASLAKKPDTATASPATSSTSAAAAPAAPSNPFFGNRILKKPPNNVVLHVKEDFNPWKVSKVPDAKSIGPMWAFSGKPYRQHFVVAAPHAQYDDGTGVMYGQGGPVVPGQPGVHVPHTPQAMHQQAHVPGQMPAPGAPPAGAAAGQQQPFGMVYQPYGPYRFHGQPQPGPQGPPQPQQHGIVQPMQMPPNAQGGPVPYGGMPPQFVGQMPFSPPMPPHAAPQAMYSPQMANMPPPGQHNQFMPPGPGGPGGPHNIGPPPGPQGNQAHPGVRPPPPHMQQKGGHGPQMYYQPQPGPMGGMPYPPQFAMQPGPGPARPQAPSMVGSGPGSEASSTVGGPTAGAGGAEPPSH